MAKGDRQMALKTSTSTALDFASGQYSYFYVTFDDVTLNVESVRILNVTTKTARLTLFPPEGGTIQTYDFAPGSDTTRNLPPNGKYNLDTWGYSFGFV
jgi:hypothetical protein